MGRVRKKGSTVIIPDMVTWHAENDPDHVAWAGPGERLTYAELDVRVKRLANGLMASGLKSGERVAYLLDNSCALEYLVSYLAVHRAGGVNVPINARLAPPEIEWILTDASAQFCVALPAWADEVKRLAPGLPALRQLVVVGEGDGGGAVSWETLARSSPAFPGTAVSLDDWADILYTSGTTGRPKGTIHTHRSALHLALAADALGLRPDDVYETPIPFYTSSGCHTYLLPALYSGCTMLIDSTFNQADVLRTMSREGTTVFFGVPSMFIYLLDQAAMLAADGPSLRKCLYGGSIMPYETIEGLHRQFPGLELINLYGLTEAGPGGAMLPGPYALTKPGSVGKAIPPFTDIRVIGDDGQNTGPDEVGEILIRTESAMQGYLGAPELTAQTLRDGWIYTGDLGRWDEDGFLYIVDRKKDVIIRGGFNVYPTEVEDVLKSHPAVLEAAVIGTPHPALGEDIKAVVVLKPDQTVGPEDLRAYCQGRIADFKIPRQITLTAALPRNAMGKVLKSALRDMR